MSLESYTGKIADLVVTNPTPTDPKSQGDDHLRGIKYTLQQTFPGFNGPLAASRVPFTPVGGIAATNVQAAMQELDTEKVSKSGDTMTGRLSTNSSAGNEALRVIASGNGTGNGLLLTANTRADEAADLIQAVDRTNGISFRHTIQGTTGMKAGVCIGGQSPSYPVDAGVTLQVRSPAAAGVIQRISNDGSTTGATELQLYRNDTELASLKMTPGGQGLTIESVHPTAGSITLKTGGAERMFVQTDGMVRFASLVGSGNRAVYSDANGRLTNTSSDATLKEGVKGLTQGLDAVMAMRPVSYQWIDKEKRGAQKEIGFIAQEMEKLVPEVIGINNDETLSLDYSKLTAVLTAAIQELSAKLDAALVEIAALKAAK